MCSGGNCGGKCLPFGPLLEGRKKNEEDKEMSDLVDEKQVKTRNEKCVCCDKLIKGQKYVFPKREGDDRSGKACCRGCLTKALNLNCAGCDKPIKGQKFVFPKREGDVRSGQPCCHGCYDKAIEKKNLELENLCHRCAAGVDGQKRKRGGRHVTIDPIFSGEFWTCEECKRKVRGRQLYIAKLEKQGKPKPRSYKKIRKD